VTEFDPMAPVVALYTTRANAIREASTMRELHKVGILIAKDNDYERLPDDKISDLRGLFRDKRNELEDLEQPPTA